MWQTWKGGQEKTFAVAHSIQIRAHDNHLLSLEGHQPMNYQLGPSLVSMRLLNVDRRNNDETCLTGIAIHSWCIALYASTNLLSTSCHYEMRQGWRRSRLPSPLYTRSY